MVDSVKVRFVEENLTQTIDHLWSMVNISQIVQMELQDYGLFENNIHVLSDWGKIIHRADRLSAMVFRPISGGRVSAEAVERIISMLPVRFDYLSIPTTHQDHIATIQRQHRHLKLMRMIGRSLRASTDESHHPSSQVYVETTFVQWQYKPSIR